MMINKKVGLVLSGGGAKGAYQVGVIKALCEMHIEVDMIAGASIGALNGALLAAAPGLEEGARRLETLWNDLAINSPLKTQSIIPPYILMLLANGLQLTGVAPLNLLLKSLKIEDLPIVGPLLSEFFGSLNAGVYSDFPLVQHMNKYMSHSDLMNGLPFYVSVFRSNDALLTISSLIAAELGLLDTNQSEFLHVQSLPPEEQREALLASAAIPALFAARGIQGSTYSDGGIGGWQKMQGNTPVQPLIDAGCQTIIVTHLSDGSLWSRHNFPDVTFMEIRPQSNISREGMFRDMLGFDANKIPTWIDQGYKDTMHCIGHIMESVISVTKLRASVNTLTAPDHSEQIDADMERSMRFIGGE